jgi:hypothetical protein
MQLTKPTTGDAEILSQFYFTSTLFRLFSNYMLILDRRLSRNERVLPLA